ncbi:sugar phosphate isomerase/epimerase family protein [Paenibacillus filicis]|uniref:Sugar phosphate isomerase/epimerase family protein n=1 Tax=Paenibacillus filicis TaxID=669464 RepID=A0ABU9DFF3_9BACL
MSMRTDCAVSTYALLELSLEEAVIRLIGEGWKAIEIMGEGPHQELLDWPEDRIAWLKRLGEEHGISWTVHAPITGCNPAASDGVARLEAERIVLRSLHIAEELGCSYIVLHPGELEPIPQEAETAAGRGWSLAEHGTWEWKASRTDQEEAIDPELDGEEPSEQNEGPRVALGLEESKEEVYAGRSLEAAAHRVAVFLRHIVKETHGSRVRIALENVPPYPNLVGVDTVFLERVLLLTDSPRVKIVFDAGHAHLTGEGNCLRSLERVLPDLEAVHLSDNYGQNDDHLALGTGTVPLEACVAMIIRSGFQGTWVLEMRNTADAHASAAWMERRRGISPFMAALQADSDARIPEGLS